MVAIFSLRQLKILCLCLFCFSLLGRCLWISFFSADTLIVVQTPFRFDPIVAGAFLAIGIRDGTFQELARLAKWIMALSSIPLIVFFFIMKGLWASHWLMETLGVSLVSLFFASAMMLIIAGQTRQTIFAHPIFRFFGRYSYGIYVTHGFVIAALAGLASLGTWTFLAIKLLASVFVAMLSWHLFEKHFIALKSWYAPNYFKEPVSPPVIQSKT